MPRADSITCPSCYEPRPYVFTKHFGCISCDHSWDIEFCPDCGSYDVRKKRTYLECRKCERKWRRGGQGCPLCGTETPYVFERKYGCAACKPTAGLIRSALYGDADACDALCGYADHLGTSGCLPDLLDTLSMGYVLSGICYDGATATAHFIKE